MWLYEASDFLDEQVRWRDRYVDWRKPQHWVDERTVWEKTSSS